MRSLPSVMSSVRWAFNSRHWQPSKQDWIKAAQCIQAEEKERIGKFVFKKDAKLSMIGRLLLRRLIHRITNIPYASIQLGRTDKGKPYLVNELPETAGKLSFNISHHGDLVVLAAETRCDVGVDVMKLETPVGSQSIPEFFRLMDRQFTESEWRLIKESGTEMQQLNTFYRLWCLKESYVKALGVGIGFEVKRLNFQLQDKLTEESTLVTTTTLQVDSDPVTDWCFQEVMSQGHCVAVAMVTAPDSQVSNESTKDFTVLQFEELMSDIEPLSEPDEAYGESFTQKDESPMAARQRQLR